MFWDGRTGRKALARMKTTTRGILEGSRTFIGGFTTGILLAVGIGQGVSAQIAPFTGNLLNSWSLDGRPNGTNWASDYGYAPKSFTNILSVPDTNVNVMLLDTNVPGHLQLNVEEGDGTTNIFFPQGTVEFWFRPNWSSTNGPGTWGRLIDVGQSNSASGWWSIYVSPSGKTINFSAQTNGLSTNYLSAQVTWASNVWHLIDLTYSDTNSALYVDGVIVTNGNGAVYWPSPQGLTNGFFVGSDLFGTNQAHGRFADLITFDYELPPTTIADDYYIAPPYDSTNPPVSLATLEQDDFATNYAGWIVQDLALMGQLPITTDAYDGETVTNLIDLSASISAMQTEQHNTVSNLLIGQTINLPQTFFGTDGTLYYFDHTNVDGSAGIKMTYGLESDETVSAQKLWPGGSSGYSLTGTNVLMAQWDGGDVLTNHQEFTNGHRVFLLDGPTVGVGVQDHPTHVAGIMAAYGVNGTAIGFANRAKVAESYLSRDLTEMPQLAATNNVRESNHSYGYAAGWSGLVSYAGTVYYLWFGDPSISSNQSWIFGFYDQVAARTNDLIIYKAQTYLPVFAAGNANGYPPPPSQPVSHIENINGTYFLVNGATRQANSTNGGFGTLTSYAVSKNDLVVGAVSPNTNGYSGTNTTTFAFFTSMGPTADGRIKPDVVADGSNVLSSVAESTSAYTNMSGTSMATPAVTGTLGLLTSFYQKLYPTNGPLLLGSNAPLASTLRAIIINTADQLGTNIGPSYIYGWGLLDSLSAANLVTNNYARGSIPFIKEVRLINGDFIQFPVVLTNTQSFKITIAWTDPPGTPVAPAVNPTNHMLVNDLDLRVISPAGTTNFPWILNPKTPANRATTGDNNLDNVEQVSIPTPTSGTYQVRITHKGTLVNDQGQTSFQNVSIALSGNVAQSPILPYITGISAITVSNTLALRWATEVGRVYKVQSENALGTGAGSWQDVSGELSATKTNMADVFYVGGLSAQFYRVIQVR